MSIYGISSTVLSRGAIETIVRAGQPKFHFGSSKCIYKCYCCYRLRNITIFDTWHLYGYLSMCTEYFSIPSSCSRAPGQWSPYLFLNKFNILVHFHFFGPIQHGIISTSKTKYMTLVGHTPKHPIYLAKKDILFTFFNPPAIVAVIIHNYCQQSSLLPANISVAGSSNHLCLATAANSSNHLI